MIEEQEIEATYFSILPYCGKGQENVARFAFFEIMDEHLKNAVKDYKQKEKKAKTYVKNNKNADNEELLSNVIDMPDDILKNKVFFEKGYNTTFSDFLYKMAGEYSFANEIEESIIMYYYAAKEGNEKAKYTIINMAMENSHYFIEEF